MSTYGSIYVQIARNAIEEVFTGKKVELPLFEEVQRKAACFVSLHRADGSLRGCIGTLEPRMNSLYGEITTNARSAAFRDSRFIPLEANELLDIQISVDVLYEPEEITFESMLDPKVYGVIVESGYRRGVLLPNLDGIDTVEEQLYIAKRKAGISSEERVKLYRFRVERYH